MKKVLLAIAVITLDYESTFTYSEIECHRVY